MRDKVSFTSPSVDWIHYLLCALHDPAHLAAAEELLPLAGLLAPKQQHVVRRPHLSLNGVIVVF